MMNNDPIAGSQGKCIFVPLDGSTVTRMEKGYCRTIILKEKNTSHLGKDNNITAIIHSFVLATDSSICLITFWKKN